jgi:hypothetical protein
MISMEAAVVFFIGEESIIIIFFEFFDNEF